MNAFIEGLNRLIGTLNASIEEEKEKNEFLLGVPAIKNAIADGKIECRYFRKNKFHAKAYITYFKDEIYEQIPQVANVSRGIALKLNLAPVREYRGEKCFTPVDLFDYIYAVLYSPCYRDTYKEFLKIDFPRVPYPTNQELFWQLVKFGGELRQMHLLESPVFDDNDAEMPIEGKFPVLKPTYHYGNVFINKEEYFNDVPEIAWELYIGGYQPAQKWLKDRKGRVLSSEDIKHYKKIIRALSQTDRIMKEIDELIEEYGGWS